ncbi:MAG: lipid II flippase MurJ, partial [Bifidobacterium sp. 56_9_plus]
MASGTAASRVTGQIRTILLAWALGTTGYAANAYQAGSMIPQVIYTLVSGGIFNAVLVPQIVRTLKAKDAETRLNKLITLAITMLLAVAILMALCTPLLTRLYVNGSPETMALATSFTLWCMPQIFFYGLYTVVGQILAAKDHFTAYAWSSVGANIISCIGFGTFIALFGRATEHPLDFWTADKIALTAGTWTLGVAFQALVLFIPLTKIGLKYRPQFGLRGIGLRSMGPVAAWSVGIVVIDQLANIVITRTSTNAPMLAQQQFGINPLDVAGNASYQNAYTIYMLPYSLIAVSLATAIFPKISRAVADHNIAEARADLSQALRNMGVIMCYFSVAFVVMPVPIILALLPSVNVREAILMAGPLVTLGVGLPFASAYLIIQRTFYAFEDGKSPFIFMLFAMGIQ